MDIAANHVAVSPKPLATEIPTEWTRTFPKVTRWEIRRKAKVHDDMNPIHHDDAAARAHKRKFKAIVACVVQLEGYIAASVSRAIPNVTARKISEVDLQYPLYPGAIPSVHCVLKRKMGLGFVTATIKNGEQVIAVGNYVLDLP